MKMNATLDKIEYLVPLPVVVDRMQELFLYPGVGINDVLEIISIDPALTLFLLNHANSSTINFEQIDSIDKACTFLGIRDIQQVVLPTFYASKIRQYSSFEGVLWQHAIGTAIIAAGLAEKIDKKLCKLAYTAALIHDLGMMIMAQYFPNRFALILEKVKHDNISFYEAEKNVKGLSHSKIGAKVARHWNIPQTLIEVISNHHTPCKSKENSKLVAIVSYADIICNRLGLGFGEDNYNDKKTHEIMKIADIKEKDVASVVFYLQEILDDYNNRADFII